MPRSNVKAQMQLLGLGFRLFMIACHWKSLHCFATMDLLCLSAALPRLQIAPKTLHAIFKPSFSIVLCLPL
jgi:hypothetical protein